MTPTDADCTYCGHARDSHSGGSEVLGTCWAYECGCLGDYIGPDLPPRKAPRECVACPESNPDCQHPTCPRFPQPGHYHAMVVAVRELAEQAKRDGGLVDPYEVLTIVDDTAS